MGQYGSNLGQIWIKFGSNMENWLEITKKGWWEKICSRFYRGKNLFQILQEEKICPRYYRGKNFVPEFSKNEKIMCFLRWTLSIFGCVEKLKEWGMDQNEVWRKTLSTMKSGRELIIYSGNWEKIRHFLFLCFAFPDLLFWERCEFFRKKGLKIWRGGLTAEERLLQNVK